jgi:uncharacterized protein (DUF427 family)
MVERVKKIPGPEHMITVEPYKGRVVVTVAGKVVADTRDAVVLFEMRHDPVYYIPRGDAGMDGFERTSHSSYCSYKGEAAYYSIPVGGERSVNAIWTYEDPFEAVALIEGRLAFYDDRVDSIEATPD